MRKNSTIVWSLLALVLLGSGAAWGGVEKLCTEKSKWSHVDLQVPRRQWITSDFHVFTVPTILDGTKWRTYAYLDVNVRGALRERVTCYDWDGNRIARMLVKDRAGVIDLNGQNLRGWRVMQEYRDMRFNPGDYCETELKFTRQPPNPDGGADVYFAESYQGRNNLSLDCRVGFGPE